MQPIQHASKSTSSGTPLVVRGALHLCEHGFALDIIPHFLYTLDVRLDQGMNDNVSANRSRTSSEKRIAILNKISDRQPEHLVSDVPQSCIDLSEVIKVGWRWAYSSLSGLRSLSGTWKLCLRSERLLWLKTRISIPSDRIFGSGGGGISTVKLGPLGEEWGVCPAEVMARRMVESTGESAG